MAKKRSNDNVIVQNRKANFQYNIGERFEAGIMLKGWELKSIRARKAQIADAYVIVRNQEVWVLGMLVDPLPEALGDKSAPNEPDRTRKLLLHKQEIKKIQGALQTKGFSCICLSLFWKKHLVKCNIALVKGKQLHDKRDAIKKRDLDREQQRAFSTTHKGK